MDRVPTPVPDVVRGMRKLLAFFLTRSVTVTVDADDATPLVLTSPGELEEILVSLAANARDALGGSGTLAISVRPGGSSGAPTAVLEVADSGAGPRPPEADPTMEALFSTMPLPSGSGFGLAAVERTVKALGGTFRSAARPEGGLVASVELPACRKPRHPEEEEAR